MSEKQNSSQFPRIFYARHMQPGICKYDNEVVLVDTDAVKKMMPSGVGKPVYINHQKVALDTLKEDANGWITESFYNELDGWAWFKILAVDDESFNAIADGWAVSNAYLATQWGSGGTKNNCPYHREILNGEFTHLAIVEHPRYEGAKIMTVEQYKAYQDEKKRQLEELHNSKPKGKYMFKLFKNVKEEVNAIDEDTLLELQNGTSVSIGEMINAVKKNAEEEAEKKKKDEEKVNGDSMVKCGDEEMPLKELINRYKKLNEKKNGEKKNEDGEDDMDEEENAKKMKKNAEEDEEAEKKKKEKKEKEEEDEKKNATDPRYFEELRNANLTQRKRVQVVETGTDMLARGRLRY